MAGGSVRLSAAQAQEILDLLWYADTHKDAFGSCSENLDEAGVCRVCRSVSSLDVPLGRLAVRRRTACREDVRTRNEVWCPACEAASPGPGGGSEGLNVSERILGGRADSYTVGTRRATDGDAA